jgi:DNA primase
MERYRPTSLSFFKAQTVFILYHGHGRGRAVVADHSKRGETREETR